MMQTILLAHAEVDVVLGADTVERLAFDCWMSGTGNLADMPSRLDDVAFEGEADIQGPGRQ
jgi:hypothetical protein